MKWIKEHRYCLWLLYFVFYFPAFFMLERVVDPKFIIECSFDRMIPFCKHFIYPYYFWYITMPGSLVLFMLKDKEAFLRLCFIMFTGMTVSLGIYFVLPNGLDLRVPFEVNDLSSWLCAMLESIDTPTNVCPSIHVSSSVAIDMAVQRSALLKDKKLVRLASFVIMLAVSVSTAFVKQHSLIDIAAGAALSVVLMLIYDFWIHKK
ncbi:MAG: hypothetical protein Q4G33_02690 [bacterium]|nr:hypothetical protein [bacterium]